MKVDKRLNLAYGSNLNVDQMALRCPTAKIYGKAVLKGYRLLFKGSYDNAYCTIEKKRGGRVPVMVWELEGEDEKALDYYEGYPRFYDKQDVKITMENGETVMAMVYVMTDKIPDRIHLNIPSPGYLETVRAGYKMAGFDEKYLEEALKASEREIEKHPPTYL